MSDYKGIKRIAVNLYLKLHAPIVRLMNQKEEAIRSKVETIDQNISCQLQEYEKLAENVQNINRQLEGYGNLTENVRNINQQLEGYGNLIENVQNINQQLEGYRQLIENIRNINDQLKGYEDLIENVRNNNIRLENIDSTLDMHAVKISSVQKAVKQTKSFTASSENEHICKADTNEKKPENSYGGIDYFDFENHFRGSREQIKQNQQIYVKYFKQKKHVLDLGCGRGEFLELLKENGIAAVGVDLYEEFVELCISKQLQAIHGDAIVYLEQQEHVDGIFAGQLIEHLSLQQLIHLAETAYDKLDQGAYLILETPNPMSLAIYTNSFYMDPSHKKPVHPLTMKYLLEKAGFREIDLIFTESSRVPVKIPALEIEQAHNIESFNAAMQEVERTLYGSQDYAIIAKK